MFVILFLLFLKSLVIFAQVPVTVIDEIATSVNTERFPKVRFYMSIDFFGTVRLTNLKNLDSTSYDFSFGVRPTVVFCLGLPYAFIEPGTTSANLPITTAAGILLAPQLYGYLLFNQKVNFIVVDWSEYNQGDFFGIATRMNQIAEDIGDQLAGMAFRTDRKLDLTTWKLIGHAMGAHMAGLIARRITLKSTNGSFVMPRITALDPVGPFLNFPITSIFFPHLEKTDAKFVDVIHSDTVSLGSSWKLGDMDFYPNMGKNQPGCPTSSFFDFLLHTQNQCSTARAFELYAISVVYKQLYFKDLYLSVRCEKNNGKLICTKDTAYMGFSLDITKPKGDYYLMTSKDIPFDLGMDGINALMANGQVDGEDYSFE